MKVLPVKLCNLREAFERFLLSKDVFIHQKLTFCVSHGLYIQYKRGYGSEWRLKQGQAVNKSRYGPLTDLPDYSFLDGRPTPLTKGQIRRRQERIEMTKKIMGLLEEVNFAKETLQRKDAEKTIERKQILENKLKPKT